MIDSVIPRLYDLVEEGYLTFQESPNNKHILFSYTEKTVYEKKWNKYTQNNRGHVYDKLTGKLVSPAMPKFFNFHELPASKSRNILKQKNFVVEEKLDGSCLMIYNNGEEWIPRTKGSWLSDQAFKARDWIYLKRYNFSNISKKFTLVCEIIYPENRIVVDYGEKEELVLLTAFNNEIGKEIPREILEQLGKSLNMPVVKRHEYTFDELFKLQETLDKNKEGFVIKLENGERIKFKGKEYLKIHKLVTQLTYKNVLKLMVDGKVDRTNFQGIDPDFKLLADSMADELENEYAQIFFEIVQEINNLCSTLRLYTPGVLQSPDDYSKEIALGIKDYKEILRHPTAIFPFIKKGSVDKYIMKTIGAIGR